MTRETLIEATVSAFRARVRGVVRSSEAWHDLDAAGREEAFEETVASRALERALDPEGLSTTARAVLDRIEGA